MYSMQEFFQSGAQGTRSPGVSGRALSISQGVFEILLNIRRCWPFYLEQVGVSAARTSHYDFLYSLLNPKVVSQDGGFFYLGESAA